MNKLHFVDISICLILSGLALFLYYNDFSNPVVVKQYYLFDKIKDLLFMVSLTFLLKGTRRKCAFVTSIFMLCRVIWQLVELDDEATANDIAVIDILFFLAMLCNIFIIFKANTNKQTP